MFDLSDALKQWKRSFSGKCSAEDVEELESHLQELFEYAVDSGLPEEEAFARTVTRIGSPDKVKSEFAKVGSMGDWGLRVILTIGVVASVSLLMLVALGAAAFRLISG